MEQAARQRAEDAHQRAEDARQHAEDEARTLDARLAQALAELERLRRVDPR